MKRAIITLTVGKEYTKMARLTHPLMLRYAKFCRADFVSYRTRTVPRSWPVHFQKFRSCRQALGKYDRVMFLDTDCVVFPSCPDLFSLVTPGMFGGFDEISFWGPAWGMTQLFKLRVCRPTVKLELWNGAHLNAGVWVFDKRHRKLFADPSTGPMLWDFPEQTLMSWRLSVYRTPIVRLPEATNYLSCYDTHAIPNPHRVDIYHITGWSPDPKRDRMKTIAKLAKKATAAWDKTCF